jgi:hypothetical protein
MSSNYIYVHLHAFRAATALLQTYKVEHECAKSAQPTGIYTVKKSCIILHDCQQLINMVDNRAPVLMTSPAIYDRSIAAAKQRMSPCDKMSVQYLSK